MTPESVNEQQLRVDSVIGRTYELAEKLGGEFENMGAVFSIRSQEPPPFCYAAFGEKGSGKTTLLSRLVGQFWETEEDAVHEGCTVWRYTSAPVRWKKTQSGGIVERYAPIDYFQTASVLDSAGSDDPLLMEQADRASAQADVIFLLFSAQNLYCPDTWLLADRFQTNGYRNVILVLTHYTGSILDAREFMDKLRQTAEQRWGYRPPAVPFYLSPPDEEERSLKMIASAIEGLASISFRRRDLLKNKLDTTYSLIQEIRTVVTAQDMALRQDGGFLQFMESEIDKIREQESRKVNARLESMQALAEELMPKFMDVAAHGLGYYPGLLRVMGYKKLPIKIESRFFAVLEESMEERLESFDIEFIESCREHWNSIRPRALQQLNCEIGEFPEENLTEELVNYRKMSCRFIFKPLTDIKLRVFLMDGYSRRESWIRAVLAACLGLLTIGSILGIIGLIEAISIFWSFSFFLWLGGAFAMVISRRNFREDGEALVEPFGQLVLKHLKRPLEESALCSVAGYRKTLSAIHARISISRDTLQPIQETLSEVYTNCYALNNSIR